MLPITFLIALAIAFELEPPRAGTPTAEAAGRVVLETCGGIGLVAALSLGLGLWIASRAARDGAPRSGLHRAYARGARLLSLTALAVFAWIIHATGWPRVVDATWGLGRMGLPRDVLVFSPFLVIQVTVWSGQYLAERALQGRTLAPASRLVRYLLSRSRQTLGLILPILLLSIIRRDVLGRLWPSWDQGALAEPIEVILLGSVFLIAAPLFIRVAWPTRPLPVGPLRRRLEQAARRAGFRFADVLVWDTGGTVLNACVTGILPGFRYVLLTDALVETMTPAEIASVFGHEIGHIAHRHLPFFALFFAGSIGLLGLASDGISRGIAWASDAGRLAAWVPPGGVDLIQEAAVLVVLGAYFWLVFGYLSRRFERQADIFGSKIVSCPSDACMAHLDGEDEGPESDPVRGPALPLCRTGLRTFAGALSLVARCNGIDLDRRSWRHGSIAFRIGFLERLERDPTLEGRFQREVVRLRLLMGTLMALALVASAAQRAYGP